MRGEGGCEEKKRWEGLMRNTSTGDRTGILTKVNATASLVLHSCCRYIDEPPLEYYAVSAPCSICLDFEPPTVSLSIFTFPMPMCPASHPFTKI
ncbi:hypothetical protein B0H13DRAFT_2358885 [Mycena leptocephala]|nr:hypothetical protein B0H13DRAFT_2358885 [Mycena leptocephala]